MNKTKIKIVDLIHQFELTTISQISQHLGFSRQVIHRYLKELLEDGVISKHGKAPYVYYSLSKNHSDHPSFIKDDYSNKYVRHPGRVTESVKGGANIIKIDSKYKKTIEENFMMIDPKGDRYDGVEGFIKWCQKRSFNIAQKSKEYHDVIRKYSGYKKKDLISGMFKLKNTFDKVYLDEVYYLDFYSIEVFGKTKLGQMMLYAKKNQNKRLIHELTDIIKDRVTSMIKDKKIDAVGFIPPSEPRKVQFLKEVEKHLALSLPKILISKIRGEYIVPQKTLSKLSDRVENAKLIRLHVTGKAMRDSRNNMIITKYKNLLLIDDAMGSGATFNEVAKKIKAFSLAKKVTGLAITGSFSGFEVISEV
jgi:DNA-binding transcriptional ArsR family regulator/predicted amidophosphoribosyltransferase